MFQDARSITRRDAIKGLGSAGVALAALMVKPAIGGGTAVKRAPVGGSCSRPERCSTTGMPTASCKGFL